MNVLMATHGEQRERERKRASDREGESDRDRERETDHHRSQCAFLPLLQKTGSVW